MHMHLFPFVLQLEESVGTSPVWISLAIIFLLFAIVFAVISGVLGFIICRTRKDVNSWISSKLTTQRGGYIYICFITYTYVSGFEKRGHFGPDLNFKILIFSEIIGNQVSLTACFMFIASWIHFL